MHREAELNCRSTPEDLDVISVAIRKKLAEARLDGFEAALRLYAYWKDGVQYVGSCGTALKRALADMKKGDN